MEFNWTAENHAPRYMLGVDFEVTQKLFTVSLKKTLHSDPIRADLRKWIVPRATNNTSPPYGPGPILNKVNRAFSIFELENTDRVLLNQKCI